MDNTDQKLTYNNAAIDKRIDSSDLLSMLNVINHLYEVSRIVLSSYSAAAVLMSLAVEVQTLLTKLRAMRQRWEIHLPFKEASSVDFVSSSKWAEQLSNLIGTGDCRSCLNPSSKVPSCHCLFDLYHEAIQSSRENAETIDLADPLQLIRYHSTIQADLTNSREQCLDTISQLVSARLNESKGLNISAIGNLTEVRSTCSVLLKELSNELYQMHEQQVKIFNAQDYERLAIRILQESEYEGRIAQREARDVMHNWRNGVPEGKLEESRKEQIENTKEEIRRTKHGVKLEQYVNLDADFSSQLSEFGRFLFNRRRDITRDELRQLIHLVYCVYYYQTDALQNAESPKVKPIAADASSDTCPALPVGFQQELRDSQVAVNCFYRILKRIEPYINNRGADAPGSTPELCAKYKDWSWYHLQTAFEKLGFLSKNSNNKAFADFINSLFPHRSVASVQRTLYRNNNVNSPNIVADVVREFQPVLSLVKPSSSQPK